MPNHEVAPGLLAYAHVEVTAGPADGFPYDITAAIEPDRGRYVVTKLTAAQIPGGPPVQRGELAKISMEPFVREAARETMQVVGPEAVRPITPTPDFWDHIQNGGPADADDLAQLAALYRWIRLQDGRPTAIMARDFAVSTATVRRWLAKAVEAGHLTQAERTK